MNKSQRIKQVNDQFNLVKSVTLKSIHGRKTSDAKVVRDCLETSWRLWRKAKRLMRAGELSKGYENLKMFWTSLYRIGAVKDSPELRTLTHQVDNWLGGRSVVESESIAESNPELPITISGDFDNVVHADINEKKILELMNDYDMSVEMLDSLKRSPVNRQRGYAVIFKDENGQEQYRIEHYFSPHHSGMAGTRALQAK